MEWHYTVVYPVAVRARWIIAVSVLLTVGCGIAGQIGPVPWAVALTVMAVLLLGGVGLPLAAMAREEIYSRKSWERSLADQVAELGEALGRHPFRADAAGVTPEMVRLHEKALKAYRAAAAGNPAKNRASYMHSMIGHSCDAIRELDLQCYGEPVLEFDRYRYSGPPRGLPMAEMPWEGKSLGPLKEFHGTGDKLIRMPAGLPEKTVFELKNKAPGRISFSKRRWPIGRDENQGASRLDEVVRGVFRSLTYPKYRYLRITSNTAWELSFLDRTGVPRFESSAQGTGDDILLYTGGPGVASFTQSAGHSLVVNELGSELGFLRELAHGHRPSFALAGPTLLQIRASQPWSLDVRPATGGELPLRTFSTVIEGRGTEPVQFTGSTSRVEVRSHGRGGFTLHLIGPDLAHRAELVSEGWIANLHEEVESSFLVKEGSILQVVTAEGNWRILVIPQHSPAVGIHQQIQHRPGMRTPPRG